MKSHGSSVRVGLRLLALAALAVGTGAACKKEEAPKPEPAQEAPSPSTRPITRHNPRGPGARMDPAANKEHRVDYCYYGTFSLRQARDAYLASLGKDEPGEKKIPSFGIPGAPSAAGAPGVPGAPAASGGSRRAAPRMLPWKIRIAASVPGRQAGPRQ